MNTAIVDDAIDYVNPSDHQSAREVLTALGAATLTPMRPPGAKSFAPQSAEVGTPFGPVRLWPTRVTIYANADAQAALAAIPAPVLAKYTVGALASGAVAISWGRGAVVSGGGTRGRRPAEPTACPAGKCFYAHLASVDCADA